MEKYKTTDYHKASYLKAHGVDPDRKYKLAGSKRVVFEYNKTEELVEMLLLYDKKEDITHALVLKSAQRDIKDIIFDEDIEVVDETS